MLVKDDAVDRKCMVGQQQWESCEMKLFRKVSPVFDYQTRYPLL
jgi:hypothetical protein